MRSRRGSSSLGRYWFAPSVLLALLCGALPAWAHSVGVSRGEYQRVAAGLEVTLGFARSELGGLAGGAKDVVRLIEVRANANMPCPGELLRSVPLENDGALITALFHCAPAEALHVSLRPLLGNLSRGHRHEAVLPNGTSRLLFEADPELDVDATPEPPARAEVHGAPNWLGFVRLGVEHILTGADHLVFLLGLVIVGLGTRRTLVVASAFTLSHSLSLACSVLGVWTPPSALVEPAIALSIAYVGIENLRERSHERRVWLALGFGLIHGFGFASALSDVHFRGLELAVALFGFNAGVELGQLAVLALSMPFVAALLARVPLARGGVRAVSAGVVVAGALWFAERVSPEGFWLQ